MPLVVSVVPKGSIRRLMTTLRRKGLLEPVSGYYTSDGRGEARQQIAALGSHGVEEGRQQLDDVLSRASRGGR